VSRAAAGDELSHLKGKFLIHTRNCQRDSYRSEDYLTVFAINIHFNLFTLANILGLQGFAGKRDHDTISREKNLTYHFAPPRAYTESNHIHEMKKRLAG
jgi:hypothetical protein